MIVFASGDHHFGEGARFAECCRVHRWIVEQVQKEKPDVFLSGGDVFDGTSSPVERKEVASFVVDVADVCPVVITRGNHDRDFEIDLLSMLRSRHPIHVIESCGVVEVAGAAIAGMAYPSKSILSAMLSAKGALAPSHQELDQQARLMMQNVLRGLGQKLKSFSGPKILLGHFMIDGSVTSLGQPLVGMDLNMGTSDLGLAEAQIVIASHIHKPQEFSWNGTPIIYCGSPYRTTFGECEEKSIVVADVTTAGVEWSRIVTPATRMVLLEAEWKDGELCGLESAGVMNSEVRVRYSVPADEREAAKLAEERLKKKLLDRLAVSVKVEAEVVATTRARAPEIATAETTWDKVEILCKTRGIDISARRPSLQEKLAELEMEAQS